jgi:hypothetical protein
VAEKPTWETTTQVLARRAPGLAWIPRAVRQYLTPAALFSAVSGLAISIGAVVNAHQDIHRLKDTVADQGTQLELLHQLDKRVAVMSNSMADGAAEVNRQLADVAKELSNQREWRERIETEAESGPHGRRRKP